MFMMLASLMIYDFDKAWHFILFFLMLVSLTYQFARIYKYTFLSKKQVKHFHGNDPDNAISIIISNVLQTNRRVDKLLNLVDKHQPDILLTLESNQWWEEHLQQIEEDYRYTVKIPLENLYGMHLFSRLELQSAKVNYYIKDDIPSIDAYVKLRSGKLVHIYCLHPMPPSPTESETSTDRDAELLLVGKNLDTDKDSVLIFGDLNDVAWSRTTSLFQKISGLLDPRVGRGFFNTFHARYPLLRWSLDHVFHSDDFMLKKIMRLPSIGSDHFPIYVKFQYKPAASAEQKAPEADAEEEEWAEEKIEKAM